MYFWVDLATIFSFVVLVGFKEANPIVKSEMSGRGEERETVGSRVLPVADWIATYLLLM
jgi:hypothetical protein